MPGRGYTIVEFLVVLGLLGLVLGVALLILTSILKASNQTNVLVQVKQNGQVVLDSLEKQIRNAQLAQKVSTNYIKLARQGQDPLHIKCFPSSAGANGWIGSVVSTANPPADSSYSALTDRDTVKGVDINCNPDANCKFDVIASSAGSAYPPVVLICFRVNQGVSAPTRADFSANVQFDTTISLRQY